MDCFAFFHFFFYFADFIYGIALFVSFSPSSLLYTLFRIFLFPLSAIFLLLPFFALLSSSFVIVRFFFSSLEGVSNSPEGFCLPSLFLLSMDRLGVGQFGSKPLSLMEDHILPELPSVSFPKLSVFAALYLSLRCDLDCSKGLPADEALSLVKKVSKELNAENDEATADREEKEKGNEDPNTTAIHDYTALVSFS